MSLGGAVGSRGGAASAPGGAAGTGGTGAGGATGSCATGASGSGVGGTAGGAVGRLRARHVGATGGGAAATSTQASRARRTAAASVAAARPRARVWRPPRPASPATPSRGEPPRHARAGGGARHDGGDRERQPAQAPRADHHLAVESRPRSCGRIEDQLTMALTSAGRSRRRRRRARARDFRPSVGGGEPRALERGRRPPWARRTARSLRRDTPRRRGGETRDLFAPPSRPNVGPSDSKSRQRRCLAEPVALEERRVDRDRRRRAGTPIRARRASPSAAPLFPGYAPRGWPGGRGAGACSRCRRAAGTRDRARSRPARGPASPPARRPRAGECARRRGGLRRRRAPWTAHRARRGAERRRPAAEMVPVVPTARPPRRRAPAGAGASAWAASARGGRRRRRIRDRRGRGRLGGGRGWVGSAGRGRVGSAAGGGDSAAGTSNDASVGPALRDARAGRSSASRADRRRPRHSGAPRRPPPPHAGAGDGRERTAPIWRYAWRTIRAFTTRESAANAASIARCAIRLIRRGTPPDRRCSRRIAARVKMRGGVVPAATFSRWRTYAAVSRFASGPMCQRSVMRWFSCTSSGCMRSARSCGWPTRTMRRSFSVVVSRFDSRRSCSSTSIESACASSITTIDRRPASRCRRRCVFNASVRIFRLGLVAGSPSSLLIVCLGAGGAD